VSAKVVHTKLIAGRARIGGGATVLVAALADRNAVERIGQEGVWVPTETYRALVGALESIRDNALINAESGSRFCQHCLRYSNDDLLHVAREPRVPPSCSLAVNALALLREADTGEGA
jgi:hypothetical protein